MSDALTALALDISGSRTLLSWIDAEGGHGELLEVVNTNHDATDYWPRILQSASDLAAGAPRPPVGVGVSFGGPVDRQGNVLSIHVGGWTGIDVRGGLAQRLGLPVRVVNDANCGALGELQFGHWGQPHTLIFLTCSTGLGGGIVSGGRLFEGSRGLAGEVGHIVVRPAGEPCCCGQRGCLEAQCSGTGMARRAARAWGREVTGAKEVFEAMEAGDEVACAVMAEVFADFGRGVANIQNVFDADLIVIGGGVSLAGRKLTAPIEAVGAPLLMPGREGHLRVESASLGLLAQLYGAASLWLRPLDGWPA